RPTPRGFHIQEHDGLHSGGAPLSGDEPAFVLSHAAARAEVRLAMIELSELHKAFGEHEVLRGLTFSVAEGEVVCLIGPSESGKSTALRCINGLERFDRGMITVDGIALSDRTLTEIRGKVAMV